MPNVRVPPPPTDAENKDAWQFWYLSIKDTISTLSGAPHNTLSGLQGGNSTERYHLTSAAATDVAGIPALQAAVAGLGTASTVSGLSVVVATAKLTGAGVNGSMTFTNGVLTAQLQAT